MTNKDHTKYTLAQQEALEQKGKTLISASAGSGKTTVMIQRVSDYLLYENGDILKLVVITFTKAAAEEMKEKLIKKLYEYIRTGKGDEKKLREAIKNIPLSHISTIDSFCYDIFKRYFEKISKDPTCTVLEPDEDKKLFLDATDRVLQEYFTNNFDQEFADLVDTFTAKRDILPIKTAIQKFSNFLSVQDDPDEFVNRAINNSSETVESMESIEYLLSEIRKKAQRKSKWNEEVIAMTQGAKFLSPQIIEILDGKLQAFKLDLDSICGASSLKDMTKIEYNSLSLCPKNDLPKKRDDETNYYIDNIFIPLFNNIANFIKGIYAMFSASPYDNMISYEKRVAVINKKFVEVATKVIQSYRDEKDRLGVVDFADIERYAKSILSIDDVAEEMKKDIDYIFIDEYQDTNNIQEKIISRLDKGNVFMVGDVKQSIYGFRFAEPRIFIKKRDNFEKGEGKNVDLNDNFRSHKKVLDFINLLFDEIMVYDFGGVDYRNTAELKAGSDSFDILDDIPRRAEIAIFEKKKNEKDDVEVPEVYSVKNGMPILEKEKYEANYIAGMIDKLVGTEMIYDKEVGNRRLLSYSDIAVITRSKSADDIMTVFDEMKIPYTAEGYANAGGVGEVELLVSFLRILDNFYQDIPLTAVMQSYIGGFDDGELMEIGKKTRKTYFWESVIDYSGDETIQSKLDSFLNLIKDYRNRADFCNVGELLEQLIAETGYDGYLMSGSKSDGIERVNSFIFGLNNKQYGNSIKEFLSAWDASDKDVSFARPSENSVSIMTIHKSKGLEFPVVFLAKAGKKYNILVDKKDNVKIDYELGLSIVPSEKDGNDLKSLASTGIDLKRELDQKMEEIRLLYVALTRAQFRLFISGDAGKDITSQSEAESYMDLIKFAIKKNDKLKEYVVSGNIDNNSTINNEDAKIELTHDTNPVKIDYTDVYAHKEATKLGSKYSVSHINHHEQDSETGISIQDIDFLSSEKEKSLDRVSLGITYHKVLEKIDLSDRSLGNIQKTVDNLLENGEIESLPKGFDIKILENVLKNDIFVRLQQGNIYREQSFMSYVSASEYGIQDSNDKVLVQGVIDMLSVGEKVILIDYKTSNLPEECIKKSYQRQIDSYHNAVKEAIGRAPDETYLFVINRNLLIRCK